MTLRFEAECGARDGDTLVFEIEDTDIYVYIGEKDSSHIKSDFVLSNPDAVELAKAILGEYNND